MTFSDEDKILIKSLHLSKGYNASRLLAEFPDKGWTKRSINSIGADSTGATGNFAPVLTQEPGQTLRFAPVPFMAVL